jgi:transcriptional regulator with XRE-family HTH domain
MTPVQSRMARAALQLGIRDVAKLAKVAPSTISRLEAGETLQPRTVEAIQRALEKAGVEFTNGNKPGVRLK